MYCSFTLSYLIFTITVKWTDESPLQLMVDNKTHQDSRVSNTRSHPLLCGNNRSTMTLEEFIFPKPGTVTLAL